MNADNTLIHALQHFPVYTLGKRGKPSDFRTPQKVHDRPNATLLLCFLVDPLNIRTPSLSAMIGA